MNVNSRLTSFGYDTVRKQFYIKTIDPEYLKVLLAEDPNPEEIVFELPEETVIQMNTYYGLWKANRVNAQPFEQLG